MSEFLDRVHEQIRDRLELSRAAVEESARLTAALAALDQDGDVGTGASARRRGAASPRRGRRVTTRGRARRGANREAVVRVLADRPGATAGEVAAASGVTRNSVYAVLRTLTAEGAVEKRELPAGGTGYALAQAGGAES